MNEIELQQIQRRVDNDWRDIRPIDDFQSFAAIACDDRRRLLLEVQRLRCENLQFRTSVKQYAEYHAYLMKGVGE